MIKLSYSIVVPQQSYDGIWIKNINIMSDPQSKTVAFINVSPYDSVNNVYSDKQATIIVNDVFATAVSSSYVANVMENIFAYVQEQITSGSVSFN